jgi:hypothetical protein
MDYLMARQSAQSCLGFGRDNLLKEYATNADFGRRLHIVLE